MDYDFTALVPTGFLNGCAYTVLPVGGLFCQYHRKLLKILSQLSILPLEESICMKL